ncbi:MAG: hypothetical protein ACFFHD_07210 [Promethearchaeota archaeon]
MPDIDWEKVEFQHFINEYSKNIIIKNAPEILYSKRDKEHEAYNSLIAFFFITGIIFIYIAFSYFLASIYFNLILLILTIVILGSIDILLIINYIKSNVYIKPLECWVDVFKGKKQDGGTFYCFVYYPIFSGKSHPNEAKNVVYKLYQEQVLKSKIDITQIEVYLLINKQSQNKIGYFFQYAEGKSFRDENINRNSWKFFLSEKSRDDNFIALANWDHQFEWRNDLEYDFDKLHEYAPWVIQRWDVFNLKPLTDSFKKNINWDLRYIESIPKLKPWNDNYENQTYENPRGYKDLEILNEAIHKIIGSEREIYKARHIKEELPLFKSYFRDLNF